MKFILWCVTSDLSDNLTETCIVKKLNWSNNSPFGIKAQLLNQASPRFTINLPCILDHGCLNRNRFFFIQSFLFFQETHPWMNGLTLRISASESSTEEELHVSLKDVRIFDSALTISDLNVFMQNAFLVNSNVYLEQSNVYSTGSAVISNSTFGQLKAAGFQIRMSNCFVDGNTEFQSPMFDIVDSELTIRKSIFYRITGKKGPLLITALFSRVIIKDVKFISNYGRQGLIQIRYGSEFFLENSVFIENGEMVRARNSSNYVGGSAVLIKSNSVAIVNNCVFIGNDAMVGSCIRTMGSNVRLVVANSTFVNNSAYEGGAILCNGRPREAKLENSTTEIASFRKHNPLRRIPGNTIKDKYTGFTDNKNKRLSRCHFLQSYFRFTDGQGAVHFRNTLGKITDSVFFSKSSDSTKLEKPPKLPSTIGFESVVKTSEETYIEIVNSTYEARHGEMVGFASVSEAFLASKIEAQDTKHVGFAKTPGVLRGMVKHKFEN